MTNRLTIALVAIVTACFGLGWIAIHKFMLGKTKAGPISLGVSVACFAGAIVFNVITLVEGVIYLTMTDETFQATYVAGTRQWF